MKHICTTCQSSFYFEIMDGQCEWTTNDSILHMTILWECPVCYQLNERRGYFPYTPNEIHKFPIQGKGDDDAS